MSYQLEAVEELLIGMKSELSEIKDKLSGGQLDYRGPFNTLSAKYDELCALQRKQEAYFKSLSVAALSSAAKSGAEFGTHHLTQHLKALEEARASIATAKWWRLAFFLSAIGYLTTIFLFQPNPPATPDTNINESNCERLGGAIKTNGNTNFCVKQLRRN